MTGRLPQLLRARLRDEGGFTLVETAVAIGVVLASLLALAWTVTIGFSDIALSRQRQGANGLANQTLEQVWALPLNVVARGLSTSHVTGDPNIVSCSQGLCYNGEQVPVGTNPNVEPLVPHQRTVTVGSTTYTVSTYVTVYQNNPSLNTFRVTAIASWPDPARLGVSNRATTQSLLFAGNAATNPGTNPFAAPQQPLFFGDAIGDVGRVVISGSIDDVPLDNATLWLSDADSNVQVEQLSAVQGLTELSGVSLKLLGEDEQTIGRETAASGATSDPATNTPYEHVSAPLPSAGTLTETFDDNTISVTTGALGGQNGTTTGAVAANTTTAPCRDRMGTSRNDSLPCGASSARVRGSLAAALDLNGDGDQLGEFTLAEVDPSTGPSRYSFVNRDATHEVVDAVTECPQASGDGCVHSELYRAIAGVRLGGLPDAFASIAPVGWNGYMVTGLDYTDTVASDVGVGSSPPSATRTGSVTYWNGAGYSTVPLTVTNQDQTITVGAISLTNALLGDGGVSINVTGTIYTGRTTLEDPAGCASVCTRTRSSATSVPPVVNLRYVIRSGDDTIANFTIHADLGTLVARGNYTPPPTT